MKKKSPLTRFHPIPDDGSVLTRRTPGIQGRGWELERLINLNEIRGRMEHDMMEHRARIIKATSTPLPLFDRSIVEASVDQLRQLGLDRQRIEDILSRSLGGDVKLNTEKSYAGYDFDHYWFNRVFGWNDREMIAKHLKEIGVVTNTLIGDMRFMDVAAGNGRVSREAMACGLRPDQIWGYDAFDGVVEKLKEEAKKLSIPSDHIFKADMRAFPEEYRQGKFDFAYCGCHGMMHGCLTEEDAEATFRGVADALRVGGRFVFDTVVVRRSPNFNPLHSFYNIAHMKTCSDWQPSINELYQGLTLPGVQVPRLYGLPRFPIMDRTANPEVSVVREVVTLKYIKKLIARYKLPLKVREHTLFIAKFRDQEEKFGLARSWMEASGLENFTKEEIRKEMDTKRRKEVRSVDDVYEENLGPIASNYHNPCICLEKVANDESENLAA